MVGADPLRGFFGQHQRGAVGVATGDGGHGPGIHHAQRLYAAHAQVAVQHGHGVGVAPHFGGAYGVEDGGGNVARQADQLFIGLVLHPGLEFLRLVARQRRLADDAARDAQALGGHALVFSGAQVIGRNAGRIFKVGAADLHRAAAGGVEVADAGGERREAVQWLAKRVQRQRLHVVLQVGVLQLRAAAGERPQLRGRHAHGPGAVQQVFPANAQLAPAGGRQSVEGGGIADFVDRANLQMVLQVGANAGQVVHHRNALGVQQIGRANARQLQQLGRVDGARAHDHLFGGGDVLHAVTRPHIHAGAADRAIGLLFGDQAHGLGRGPHLKIGAAIALGAQKGFGGVPAQTVFLVDLKVAHAFVAAGVEVGGGGNARLLRGLRKRIQDVPAQALLFNAPFALAAVQRGKAGVVGLAFIQSPVAFMPLECGQHVVPGPGVIAGQLGPLVVVACLAAHVNHAVDAGAATQRLAARVAQAAAVEASVGFCLVEPVGAGVANAVQIPDRNVDPVVVVFAPCFQQQHAHIAVCAQAVAEQSTCGSAPNNDVVECGFAHGVRCQQASGVGPQQAFWRAGAACR